MMAFLGAVLGLALVLSCSVVHAQPVRLVSASVFDGTKGFTILKLAQDDIDATKSALQWQNQKTPGSVLGGYAGVTLNQNVVPPGVLKPEWASYAKVIDFKNVDAYKVYNSKAAPSFTWTSYTKNKNYLIGNKVKFVGTIGAADVVPKTVSANVVFHVSGQNATNGVSGISAVVSGRSTILKAVSSLTVLATTTPWTASLAATDADPLTILNLAIFTSPQAAVAYKAFKAGNKPPGPVGPLPLYTSTDALVNVKKDIEYSPVSLL